MSEAEYEVHMSHASCILPGSAMSIAPCLLIECDKTKKHVSPNEKKLSSLRRTINGTQRNPSEGTGLELKVQLLILDFRSVEGTFLYQISERKLDIFIFNRILHVVLKTLLPFTNKINAFSDLH